MRRQWQVPVYALDLVAVEVPRATTAVLVGSLVERAFRPVRMSVLEGRIWFSGFVAARALCHQRRSMRRGRLAEAGRWSDTAVYWLGIFWRSLNEQRELRGLKRLEEWVSGD